MIICRLNQLDAWICPETGALVLHDTHQGTKTEIPYEDTQELVSLITSKRYEFGQQQRAKLTLWQHTKQLFS